MSLLNQPSPPIAYKQITRVTYHIAGFDRPNFVSDIANTVPQDGSFLIRTLAFEADGIRANGTLTIQVQPETQPVTSLTQRLQSVRGLVSLRESHD